MTATPMSLLDKLRQSDEPEQWQRLTTLYTPLIHRWLSRYQLQQADIDDLVQEVLLYVAGHIPHFQHNGRSGAFRCWLRTILTYRLRKLWKAGGRNPAVNGGSKFLEQIRELEDPASGISQIWNREHDQHVAQALMKMIRQRFADSTWQAFCRTVLDGANTKQVAEELAMTPNAVCVAKSRVMRELRQEGEGLLD